LVAQTFDTLIVGVFRPYFSATRGGAADAAPPTAAGALPPAGRLVTRADLITKANAAQYRLPRR
jgi:hypothetical protein